PAPPRAPCTGGRECTVERRWRRGRPAGSRRRPAAGTAGSSRLLASKPMIAAAVVQQRLAVTGVGRLDASDEDRVIPLDVGVYGLALELGQRTVDERHAEHSEPERHAVELVQARGGEATGDRLVLAVQKVDAEAAGLAQRRIALALMIDADQHERR